MIDADEVPPKRPASDPGSEGPAGVSVAGAAGVLPIGFLYGVALLRPSLDDRYGGPTAGRVALLVVSVLAAIAATGLVIRWIVGRRLSPAALGFGRRGLIAGVLEVAIPTAGGAAILVALAHTRHGGWDHIPDLGIGWAATYLKYTAWACLQQLLVLGVVQRRLREGGAPTAAAVVLGAGFFALLHLPNLPLVALTAVAGLVWGVAFARRGNLFAIALSHGVVGVIADEILDMDLHVGLHYWERLAYRASLGEIIQ